MLERLLLHPYEAAAIILFGIGFTSLMLHKNMIKKIIGFNMMDSAIFLFLAAKRHLDGRPAPALPATGRRSCDPERRMRPKMRLCRSAGRNSRSGAARMNNVPKTEIEAP